MRYLRNSKTTPLGSGRFTVDGFIGAAQMSKDAVNWQDIKPHLVRDIDGWHIEGAPYRAKVGDDGSRLFIPDPDIPSKFFKLPTNALWQALPKSVISNPAKIDKQLLPNQITMPTGFGEMRFIFSNTGMCFEVLFREPPPKTLGDRFTLDFETAKLDLQKLLLATQGLGIPAPRLIDNNLEERPLYWSEKEGQLELGFDLTGLTFPVLLKNNSLDVDVAAGADDCVRRLTPSFFSATWAAGYVGYVNASIYQWGAAFRFTNITIPQGSAIGAGTNLTFQALGSYAGVAVNTRISAEDVDNPGDFSLDNAASFDARYAARTAARVDWNNIGAWVNNTEYTSTELMTVEQELVDRVDWDSGDSQVWFFEDFDDRSTHADNCHRDFDTFETATPNPAHLHIEYTVPTGGAARGWAQK